MIVLHVQYRRKEAVQAAGKEKQKERRARSKAARANEAKGSRAISDFFGSKGSGSASKSPTE